MHEPDHVSETPGEHNVSDDHLYQRELMACEHMCAVVAMYNGDSCKGCCHF